MERELTLRSCTADDVDALRTLSIRTYYETFASMSQPEAMDAYLAEAYDRNKLLRELTDSSSLFLFLYADGALVGYLKLNEASAQTDLYDDASLEIERIYVTGTHHGQGLGQYLMDQALRIAAERRKTYVWLGVWERNERALRFYRRNGFYPIGTHSFFMGEDEQTDHLMRRDLP